MRGSFLNCFSTLILGYMSWTNKLHRFLLFGKPALNESKEHFRTCSVPALYQSKRRKSTPSIPFSCFGVTWGTVSAEKESRKNGWLLVKGQSWWGVLGEGRGWEGAGFSLPAAASFTNTDRNGCWIADSEFGNTVLRRFEHLLLAFPEVHQHQHADWSIRAQGPSLPSLVLLGENSKKDLNWPKTYGLNCILVWE